MEVELLGVELLDLFEGLDELDGVVPLAVQDELAHEENVVWEGGVDDARFPLQVQHAYVEVAVGQELHDQLDDVLLLGESDKGG